MVTAVALAVLKGRCANANFLRVGLGARPLVRGERAVVRGICPIVARRFRKQSAILCRDHPVRYAQMISINALWRSLFCRRPQRLRPAEIRDGHKHPGDDSDGAMSKGLCRAHCRCWLPVNCPVRPASALSVGLANPQLNDLHLTGSAPKIKTAPVNILPTRVCSRNCYNPRMAKTSKPRKKLSSAARPRARDRAA
jgi:hypothetical protein